MAHSILTEATCSSCSTRWPVSTEVDPAARFETYVAMLTFAQLAFKVVGFVDPLPSSYLVTGNTTILRQFWPLYGGPINWPPAAQPGTNRNLPALLNFTPLRPS
jgi:hypothetical protein